MLVLGYPEIGLNASKFSGCNFPIVEVFAGSTSLTWGMRFDRITVLEIPSQNLLGEALLDPNI